MSSFYGMTPQQAYGHALHITATSKASVSPETSMWTLALAYAEEMRGRAPTPEPASAPTPRYGSIKSDLRFLSAVIQDLDRLATTETGMQRESTEETSEALVRIGRYVKANAARSDGGEADEREALDRICDLIAEGIADVRSGESTDQVVAERILAALARLRVVGRDAEQAEALARAEDAFYDEISRWLASLATRGDKPAAERVAAFGFRSGWRARRLATLRASGARGQE